jgi:uncharacterized membrane-anchored protein YitT (DUF2179 family)
MTCPDCKSERIDIQIITEKKQRSVGSVLLWILGAIFTFGIILLIPLLVGNESVRKTYAVCQECGFFVELKTDSND